MEVIPWADQYSEKSYRAAPEDDNDDGNTHFDDNLFQCT